jgi:hypothetical protein
MPAEPPPEPSELPVAPARARARRIDTGEVAEAERRLNSPTPLTLQLLGVVFLATLLPWLAAKVACNGRESPVRQPHDLATDVIAKNPKSTALELSQRAASGRFREAAELASGEVAQELLDADARCQAEPAPCEQRRALSERVFTRAVVASRGPMEATVRTESRVADATPERHALRLTQTDGRWSVVRRTPLAGEVDAPVSPDEQVSPIAVRSVPGQHPHGAIPTPGLSAPPGSVTLPHAAPHDGVPQGSAPSTGASGESPAAP